MRLMLASIVALSAALVGLSPHAVAAESLAGKLPEETILFAEVDVGGALKSLREYLRLIDPERAEGLEENTLEVVACLKEVAAQQEFTPLILDNIAELKLYLVLMAKDEPEVTTHTYRTPKWDPIEGERIEGEFEEHTYTTRKEFTFSVVAETPSEEIAADFVEQVKGLVERLTEDAEDASWREVEVDAGEMFSDPEGGQVLGRLGKYVVFSDSNPVELWAALVDGADPSVADSPVYRRLHQEAKDPAVLFYLNVAVLIERSQEALLRNLEEAEEKFGPAPAAGGGGFNEGAYRIRMARAGIESFLALEKLFSLDKIGAVGVAGDFSVGDESAVSNVKAVLHVSEPLSTILDLILDSGHPLEAPEVGERDGIIFMARLGLKEIFSAVKEDLEPKNRQPIDAVSGMLKMQIGYDIGEILAALAGDASVYVDFDSKEVERRRWDPETGEVKTEMVVEPVPIILFLLGVENGETFSQMLSSIVGKLTGMPGMAAGLGKRIFLASDIYLVGPGAGRDGAEPDGIESFAAAVVGRQLAVGSWEEVTGLVRRAGAGADEGVSTFVEAHAGANILLFVPGSFTKKFQELMKAGGEDPYDEIRKELANLDELPIEDEQLRERLLGAITRLVEDMLAVAEKGESGSAGAYLHGERLGDFYEIRMRSEIKK